MKVGMEWVYRIHLSEENVAIKYREEFWPFGPNKQEWNTLLRTTSIRNTYDKEQYLHIKIKKNVSKEDFPSTAKTLVDCEEQETREIEILKDDLSIFGGVKQVFWVKCPYPFQGMPRSVIYQVTIYDIQIIKQVADLKPVSDGFSRLPLFITAGIGLSITDTPSRSLTFEGVMHDSRGGHLSKIHFSRRINIEFDGLKEVIENMIYAKGQGMIELRQYFDGKPSMTWTLVEFMGKSITPGFHFSPTVGNGAKDYSELGVASKESPINSKQAKELYNKANFYIRKEDYDTAIMYYNRALILNPKHVQTYNIVLLLTVTEGIIIALLKI